MKFKWIKKEQRKINHYVRAFNKILQEDELWRGRFYVKQEEVRRYITFEDGSGGEIIASFSFRDKKTGIMRIAYFTNYDFHNIARVMNDFIIKDVDVWHETPRPSLDNVIDYTKNNIDNTKITPVISSLEVML